MVKELLMVDLLFPETSWWINYLFHGFMLDLLFHEWLVVVSHG